MLQHRTRSTCGTPDYFAPELLAGKGYLWSVDWWCVGVLMYEMLYGETPFEADSAMQMFKRIVSEEAECAGATPTGLSVPPACAACVAALLEKDPEARLGRRSTYENEVEPQLQPQPRSAQPTVE